MAFIWSNLPTRRHYLRFACHPPGTAARVSAQFRSIEVAALEKRQRHLKNPGLATLKFEFLSTLRHGTALSDLYLGLSHFSSLPNHDPSPTFGTGHARARNAIGHRAQLYCAIHERPCPRHSVA